MTDLKNNYNEPEENIKSIGYERVENYMKKKLAVAEKDERRKAIKDAIIISTLDAGQPSKEAIKLMEQYVEGEIELSIALKIILDKYKKLGEK